jgi:hypothetical protein
VKNLLIRTKNNRSSRDRGRQAATTNSDFVPSRGPYESGLRGTHQLRLSPLRWTRAYNLRAYITRRGNSRVDFRDHNKMHSTCVQRHRRITPHQFKLPSHSLRKDATSAATCIGAPLTKTRYMGG